MIDNYTFENTQHQIHHKFHIFPYDYTEQLNIKKKPMSNFKFGR